MADLSDVSNALGQMAGDVLYPPASFPSVGDNDPSIAGIVVLVQVGWPDPQSLARQIAAGRAQVTVYPRPTERNTTRYPRDEQVGALQAKTFTLDLSGQNVTVGGAEPSVYYRQNVCVFVNRKPYIYSTIAGDTPTSIAAGLAALVLVDVAGTTAVGAVLAVPSPAIIGALRVGTGAPTITEVKRQERDFQLIIWAPTQAARDAIAKVIDVAIGKTDWLTFADATKGRMIYKGSPYTDFDQKQGIYRRDFLLSVEYPTTNLDFAPEIVAIRGEVFANTTVAVLETEGPQDVVTETGQQINLVEPDLTINY